MAKGGRGKAITSPLPTAVLRFTEHDWFKERRKLEEEHKRQQVLLKMEERRKAEEEARRRADELKVSMA